MSCISVLGVIGLFVSLFRIFSTPRFRVFRAVFFVVFGCFAIFPVPHMVALLGWQYMWPLFWKELLVGASYILGAAIYSSRVPERFFPGKLDNSWYSHPIWHLFVIGGGIFQLWACVDSYRLRMSHPC